MKTPIELFEQAELFVRENGFGWEVDWCDHRASFDKVEESDFLREYAWVVLNSGMSNKVINSKWQQLSAIFLQFEPHQVAESAKAIRIAALLVFGNRRKIDAILFVAQKICDEGFPTIKKKVKQNTLSYLFTLPFIGPITKFHLARNLGFDFIKPDRHLVKLASKYGMHAFELCDLIHKKTKRRLGTIDVILWRFCEQKGQVRLLGENVRGV